MKVSAAILSVFLSSSAFVAASSHDSSALLGRHARIAQRDIPLVKARSEVTKRCKPRKAPVATTSSKAPETKETSKADDKKDDDNKGKNNDNKDNNSNNQQQNNNSGGSGSCGNRGATKSTTATSGPNGAIGYFNCGIDAGGWNPPYLSVDMIQTVSLSDAINSGSSPFHACSKFVSTFEKYGSQNGLPAILLASFALQESSCNPDTVGGAGEQGLMQLTKDKCGGAPGGNCRDPDFNIRTGAKYFADTLRGNNGNLLPSIGQYNGWFKGMTYAQATAAGNGPCCRCMNNLDYLQQMLNGWVLNKNAYDNSLRLGKYFNLDKCN